MAKSNEEQKKAFCVIQFKDLPFVNIDTYVCVPDSWLITWTLDGKALVAHPVEDPFVTKARVKRREQYRSYWTFFTAYIKYESDSYGDAQNWIATQKKGKGRDLKYPVPEAVLVIKGQSTTQCPTSNSSADKSKLKLNPYRNSQKPNEKNSIKRPMQSDLKNEHSEKRQKIDETAATSNSKKITSKTIQCSHVTEEKPFVQPAHLNTLQSTKSTSLEKKKSPIYKDRKNGADMPSLEKPTEGIINNMSAGQIQQPNVQQYIPNQENDLMQTPQVRNRIKTSTQDQSIDKSGFHGAFMKEKRAFQSKPNPENQPSSLARNENQCKQANLPKDAYEESFLPINRNYTSRDPRLLKKQNANAYTEKNANVRAAHPKSIMVEQTPTMQSVEIQPTSSSNRSQETKYNKVYQNPQTLKMGFDQSTETTADTKVVQYWANLMRKASRMCQTDDYSSGKSLSLDQAFISGNEAVTNNKVIPDYEMRLKAFEMRNEADSPTASIPLKDDPPAGPIADQPTTSSNPLISRNVIAQRLLHQMGTTLSQTCNIFKSLHSSILESINKYYTLREAVRAFEAEEGNPNNNNYNNVGKSVNKAPKPNQGHNRTFVLPPEYDPNDSKWTLRYRRSKRKRIELMPQSDIYVNYSRFKRCKRAASDCNTLAQLLLMEVFTISALSVCSLTGREAEPSSDVDNVRPGLDEWARMVLLKFVQKFGLERGWNTSDTEGILKSMRDVINEFRATCG